MPTFTPDGMRAAASSADIVRARRPECNIREEDIVSTESFREVALIGQPGRNYPRWGPAARLLRNDSCWTCGLALRPYGASSARSRRFRPARRARKHRHRRRAAQFAAGGQMTI